MRLHAKLLLLTFFLAYSQISIAQKNGNLPYSRFGIGETQPGSAVRNMMMGGVGIGYADPRALNILNPATVAYNGLTMFDVAARVNFRQLESVNETENNKAGNLSYLNISFPLSTKWSTVLSVRPFSEVSYNYDLTGGTVANAPNTTQNFGESGSGGLSKVAVSNGVLLGKGFAVGLELGYVFGIINKETSRQLVVDGQPINNEIVTIEELNYDDFSTRGGLTYRGRTPGESGRYFMVGAAYEHHVDIQGKRKLLLERRVPGLPSTLRNPGTDTLAFSKGLGFNLPSKFEVGVSMDQPGKWAIALDAGVVRWSAFEDFSSDDEFEDSYYAAIGGEYIPDAGAVTGYHKRITYKAGFRFERSPYSIRGQRFNDVGINFGFCLPVNKKAADVNLAFQLGQRGTVDSNLIREKYLNVVVGFTINDKWFRKKLIY